jgi:poly(beta-D-mannuronate) lyase
MKIFALKRHIAPFAMAAALTILPSQFISASAFGAELVPIWPTVKSDTPIVHGPQGCGVWPRPVRALATETRYAVSDPTRTKIDLESSKKYEALVAPVREFARRTVALANDYEISRGKDQESAFCASRALYIWATGKGLTEATTDVANFNRATFLSGVAAAYIQIKGSKYVSVKEREAIETWLADLVQSTRSFYQVKRDSESVKPNNIQYWAGLAVATAGVALNRRDDFDWGIKALELGACTATIEGALPRELEREQRARHYHMFALQPLVALAELAERNGRKGYAVCGGSLHDIVKFTLDSIDSPTNIEWLTGVKQLPLDAIKSDNDLAWLEIYAQRFPNFAWRGRMASIRPFANTNLGGKLTELYQLK